jgi:hypothetical protein
MSTHPAVLVSKSSAQHAMSGDKQAWLSLFAEESIANSKGLCAPRATRHNI